MKFAKATSVVAVIIVVATIIAQFAMLAFQSLTAGGLLYTGSPVIVVVVALLPIVAIIWFGAILFTMYKNRKALK